MNLHFSLWLYVKSVIIYLYQTFVIIIIVTIAKNIFHPHYAALPVGVSVRLSKKST